MNQTRAGGEERGQGSMCDMDKPYLRRPTPRKSTAVFADQLGVEMSENSRERRMLPTCIGLGDTRRMKFKPLLQQGPM